MDEIEVLDTIYSCSQSRSHTSTMDDSGDAAADLLTPAPHYRLLRVVSAMTSPVASMMMDIAEPLLVVNVSVRGHETSVCITVSDGAGWW